MLRNMMIVALVCCGASAMAMTEKEQLRQAMKASLEESLATVNNMNEDELKQIMESSLRDTKVLAGVNKEESKYTLEMGIAATQKYLDLQEAMSIAGPEEVVAHDQNLRRIQRILNTLRIRLIQLKK